MSITMILDHWSLKILYAKKNCEKICIIKIIEMENIFTSLIFKGAKEIWGPIIEDPHTHIYIYIYNIQEYSSGNFRW